MYPSEHPVLDRVIANGRGLNIVRFQPLTFILIVSNQAIYKKPRKRA